MTASPDSVALTLAAAEAASSKLAEHVLAFDVSDQLAIADVFLLCSAPNDRQVRAVVDAIEDRLAQRGRNPVRREGERAGRWVLLDYLDLVVHVMHTEERDFYSLERLWKDCPAVPLAIAAESRR